MARTKYQSVYYQPAKDGHKGYYYYSIYLGKDPLTGKKIIKKARRDRLGNRFKTARAAHLEVQRVLGEIGDGTSVHSSQISLENFMSNVYIPNYRREVENSTWSSRKSIFKLIKERLGAKSLKDITPKDCFDFRSWLLSSEAGYSQSFASIVYGIFRQVLDTAVDLDYLLRNPSRVKKATRAIAKGPHTINYWTLEEFKEVVSKCYLGDIEGALAYVMFNLYYFTGLRVSEGLALWWSDINLHDGYIRVNHTLTNSIDPDKKRKNYTKTMSSMRTIDIPNDLVKLLKWWKQVQYDNLPQNGNDHYVLSATDRPLHRSSVNNTINRYAKLAGVHHIQARELRTSHVCLLINKYNVDILAVSQRLGHAKPTTTLQYYSELWRGRNRTVADQMNGAMGHIDHPDHSLVNFTGNQFVKV